MKVLVTGATTPLGVAIAEQLLACPDVMQVLAAGFEPEPAPLRVHSRLAYVQVDLTHPRSVHDLLWGPAREHGVEIVIHGAQHRGARDVGRAVHVQNVGSTRELLRSAANHPTIRRFVQRSFAEVYSLARATSDLIDETEPLTFEAGSPQWLRDRVEADLTACAQLGGPLAVAVLRCSEIVAAGTGSQLWDYLSSRVCLRPLGFDPMLNVLSLPDAAAAFVAAARAVATGVFNIPGLETLPLTRAIAESGRLDLPVPGMAMAPLYNLRRWIAGGQFRYDLNTRRFHFGGVVEGRRARELLRYLPQTAVTWPT